MEEHTDRKGPRSRIMLSTNRCALLSKGSGRCYRTRQERGGPSVSARYGCMAPSALCPMSLQHATARSAHRGKLAEARDALLDPARVIGDGRNGGQPTTSRQF